MSSLVWWVGIAILFSGPSAMWAVPRHASIELRQSRQWYCLGANVVGFLLIMAAEFLPK